MTVIYNKRKYKEDENGNIITNGRTQLDIDFYLSKNGKLCGKLPTFNQLYGWSATR